MTLSKEQMTLEKDHEDTQKNYYSAIEDVENDKAQKYRQYTRHFRDIFHEFHNLPLPKNGIATAEIFHLIIVATWINNTEDYDAVVAVLVGKGITDISRHEYFNREYWRKRIRRSTPDPAIHALNIRKILNMLTADFRFENIMSEKVKEWFEKYASTAEEGFYQVPDDVFHYTCVGTDIDGLSLY